MQFAEKDFCEGVNRLWWLGEQVSWQCFWVFVCFAVNSSSEGPYREEGGELVDVLSTLVSGDK